MTEKNSTSTVKRRSTSARAQVSSTRTLRPRQPVNYAEIPEPDADGFIWCSTCGTEEYNGCEKHVTLFGDNKMFKLEIGPSAIKGLSDFFSVSTLTNLCFSCLIRIILCLN